MADKKTKKKAPSTQQHIPIAEIKEGVVILRSGGLRSVLLVSSVNFDLKSDEEQTATIQSYVSFLNSLQHPVQIVVQSRELDVDEYLEQIKERQKQQTNELLRLQTAEYGQYISELVEVANIMSKRYFVVIPYEPIADVSQGFFGRLQQVLWPSAAVRLSRKDFVKRKAKIEKRILQVQTGLANIGLQTQLLDTQSLIELYYNTLNPVVAKNQALPSINKLDMG